MGITVSAGSFFRAGRLALAILGLGALALHPAPLAAQGEDNPTGVAGAFNGFVTTGGGYDAYTGSATRTVPDLVVAGAVGEIPLAFFRTFSSRGTPGKSFGSGGPWRHSYEWTITDNTINTTPTAYRIIFPDGRDLSFAAVSGQTWWRGPAGTPERLEFVSGNRNTGSGLMRLHLGDGSKLEIEFDTADQSSYNENKNQWTYRYVRSYRVARLIDRHTRVTTLAYDGWPQDGGKSLLVRVTEPAGRFIDIRWTTDPALVPRIVEVESSNRGTWIGGPRSGAVDGEKVVYAYGALGSFVTLDSVTYNYDRWWQNSVGWTVKQSLYTYVDPPGYAGSAPLLATAVDPRFPGAMTRIRFQYWPNMARGFLKSESYLGTGGNDPDVMVSQLDVPSASTRLETRGDGPQRTFTYSYGRIASATNFRSTTEKTNYEYDTNGLVSRVVDSEQRAFTIYRENVLGKVTSVLREADNVTVQAYTYSSATDPYFVATFTDARGKTTSYTPNARNQVTSITYPSGGGSESFTYVEDGKYYLPATRITADQALVTFTYGQAASVGQNAKFWEESQFVGGGAQAADPASLLTQVSVSGTGVPAGEQRNTFYDVWGRPIRSRNARGYEEILDYDRAGRPAKTTHVGARSGGTGPDYDATGRPTTVSGLPADATTVLFSYDASGNPTQRTDELSHSRTASYDAYRRPIWSRDETNRQTSFLYQPGNAAYPAMASTFAQPGVVILPGDAPGTPRQVHSYFTPDRWLQIRYTAVGTADQAWTQQSYDSLGRVRFAWDSTGRGAVETRYDARGFAWDSYDPEQRRTWREFDNAGNVLVTHLPDTRTLSFSYNDMGRAWTSTDQKGQTITKTYYAGGSVATLKDARNQTYSFEIDALGRQRRMIYPADQAGTVRDETITYDLDGLVKSKKDRFGTTWGTVSNPFEYDHRGRLYRQPIPASAPGARNFGREFNYDAAGRVARVTNGADSEIDWTYDDAGRVNSELQYQYDTDTGTGYAKTITYAYDTPGRRAQMFYPNGWTRADYGYNGRDQIASVQVYSTGGGALVGATFGYAGDGQMNRISRNNNVETTMGFDPTGRIASHSHARAGTVFASRTYGYDDLSRLTEYKHGNVAAGTPEDGRGTRFAYWEDGQLATAWHDATQMNPVGGQRRDEQFWYDANGNRGQPGNSLGWRVGYGGSYADTSYAANNLNQYTAVTSGGTQTPGYDANGNLSQFEGWNYSTNAEAQVTQIALATGGNGMEVRHDPLGRVFLRKFPDGTKRRYFYDGANVIEEFDENNVDRAVHVHAPGVDNVMATLSWSPAGYSDPKTNYYRLYDARNNVTHLVHASTGATLETYRYDAFGQPWLYSPLDASYLPMAGTANENRYLFTGREWFPEVGNGGLYDYRARLYHPRLGRFVQADPIGLAGGDTNIFRYCANDPINGIDPTGLFDSGRPGVNIFNQAVYSSPTSPAAPVDAGVNDWSGWSFGGPQYIPSTSSWLLTPTPGSRVDTSGSQSTPDGTTSSATGGNQVVREALEDFGRFGAGLINRTIGLIQGTAQLLTNPIGFVDGIGQAIGSFSVDPLGQIKDYFSAFADPNRAADAFAGIAFNAGIIGAGGGAGTAGGTANNTLRVGRWMSEAEFKGMQSSGRVVESQLRGVTSVSSPPNSAAWVPKGGGSPVFATFDIPSSALRAADGAWGKIYGPSSIFGPKLGITEMPPATNITRMK